MAGLPGELVVVLVVIGCVVTDGTDELRTVDVVDELDAVCLAVVAMTHRNKTDALELVALCNRC